MFMHGDWASKLAMAAVLAVGLVGPCTATAVMLVTNGNDSGAGSFRAALSEASKSDTPATILVMTHAAITINSTLIYRGKAPLAIYGRGQTVSSNADTTLMIVSAGADLAVRDLNFRGRGGFSSACPEREVQFYKSGFVKSYKFSIDFYVAFDVDDARPAISRQ